MAARLPEISAGVSFEEVKQGITGKTIPDALTWCDERGLVIRTTRVDGHPKVVTRDVRPNRVNVSVVNNEIVEVLGIG